MAIESEKNCETCALKDLDNSMYPCRDCNEDNNYKHFKEKDDGSKETVDYLVSMFELIDILNEFEKDYAGESAKEDIKMAIESEKNCETCKFGELNKIQYPCCDCYGDNDYKHFKEQDEEPKETVNHPNHYQSSKFEVIDIIDEFGKDYTGESAFDFGNVVKYVLRAKKKNGLEDLKKAQWYLNRLIDKWED